MGREREIPHPRSTASSQRALCCSGRLTTMSRPFLIWHGQSQLMLSCIVLPCEPVRSRDVPLTHY